MAQRFKSRNRRTREFKNSQRGYLLITLMLAFALMAIALLAVTASVKQQIQRDREAELQHRGTMYMRAIQHYYKKFGRYPARLEDLESTNQQRFLRKRYKDPMSRDPETGKDRDFKLLHLQDVMLNNGPTLGQMPGLGAGLPGQNGLPGALNALAGGPNGPQGGNPAAARGLQSTLGQMGQLGGMQTVQTGLQNQNASGSDASASAGDTASGNSSSESSGASNSDSTSSTTQASSGSGGTSGPNSQTFGGSPILGVASTNKKDTTIRVFNKKDHYNDWYFIYDPTMDRKGLLVGPWQPLTIGNGAGLGLGQAGSGGMGPGGPQPTGLGGGIAQPGLGGSQPGFGQPQNPPGGTPPNAPQENSPDN